MSKDEAYGSSSPLPPRPISYCQTKLQQVAMDKAKVGKIEHHILPQEIQNCCRMTYQTIVE